MSEITKSDVIEYISNMKVIELSELVKDLEEKFPEGSSNYRFSILYGSVIHKNPGWEV